MQYPSEITSERLRITPLALSDAVALHDVTNHPKITDTISFLSTPFALEDAQNLIAEGQPPAKQFYGIRLYDKQLIGFFAIIAHDGGAVEIGYWVGVEYQGKGYASEALRAACAALDGWQIIAECLPSNLESWKVLEKNGFRFMGEDGVRPDRKKLVYIKV